MSTHLKRVRYTQEKEIYWLEIKFSELKILCIEISKKKLIFLLSFSHHLNSYCILIFRFLSKGLMTLIFIILFSYDTYFKSSYCIE